MRWAVTPWLRRAWSVPALVAAVALAAYLRTLAPTVTLVDSGELILAAHGLGVAHPPGFPLYVLLAHAATRIPLGSVAQRVNALSALFAALAAAACGIALRELLRCLAVSAPRGAGRDTRRSRKAAKCPPTPPLRPGAATVLATGLVFAFSRTLWGYSTVAEVYTLNAFLVASALALVLRFRGSESSQRPLVAAALAFGLGLGVHHVTVALTLPALLVLALARSPRPPWHRLLAFPALVALLVAGLLYLTLPVLAARQPVLSWGDPTSLQRLLWHVSGRQYSSYVSLSLASALPELTASLARTAVEFGRPPLVPALALVGFVALWRRDHAACAALATLVAANLAFTSLYTIAEDKDAYQLPVFLALAVAAGVGAEALRASLLPRFRTAGATTLLVLPLIPLLSNFESRDRSGFLVAADYAENALRAAAPGALLLTSDWQLYSPLLYVQEVEGRRRDTTVIDVSLLRRSWYLAFLERRFPALMGRVSTEVREFLEDLRGWEKDPALYDRDPGLNRRINARFQALMTALVAAQLEGGGAYATHEVVIPQASPDPVLARLLFEGWTLRPRGVVFELSLEKGFPPLGPLDLQTRGLAKRPAELDDVVATKVRPAYLVMLVNRGRYLAAAQDLPGAREAFERALQLDPELPQAREGLDQIRLRATNTRSRE